MKFNLGSTPVARTTSNALKANAIHTVKFKGVEASEIDGKNGEKYSTLLIKFANDEGVFEDRVFEPKPSDMERQPNSFGGESPSNMEQLIFKLRHLIFAVAPKVHEAIEKAGGVNVESWAQLVKFMVDKTAKSIDTETQIKLIADKNGYARFPGFVLALNKDGELYPKTNFIGAKLAFTAKELEKINAAATATPTRMDNAGSDLNIGGAPAGVAEPLPMDDDLELDLDI